MKPQDSLCCPSTCRGQFEFVNLCCIFYVLLENVVLWLAATWLYTEMQHSHSAGQHQRSCAQPTKDSGSEVEERTFICFLKCHILVRNAVKYPKYSQQLYFSIVLPVEMWLCTKYRKVYPRTKSMASVADTRRLVLYQRKIIVAVMMPDECGRHGRISGLQRVTAVELLLRHEAQAQPGSLN